MLEVDRTARAFTRTIACFIAFVMVLAGSSGDAADWLTLRTTNGPVAVPKAQFVDIAKLLPHAPSARETAPLAAPGWVTRGRQEVGMLGLDSTMTSDAIPRLRRPITLIVGRYSPQTAQLRVQALRLERRPDGAAYVSLADFTPWHGEYLRAYGRYRTLAEQTSGAPGYNPFNAHRGDAQDPIFHRMTFAAAQVAMGLAMRTHDSVFGWLAVSDYQFKTMSTTVGGLFFRTVTWTIDGFVKPQWYLLSSRELAASNAISAVICADPGQVVISDPGPPAVTDCDESAHRVSSGVWATVWTGGKLPSSPQRLTVSIDVPERYSVAPALVAADAVALLPEGVGVLENAGVLATGLNNGRPIDLTATGAGLIDLGSNWIGASPSSPGGSAPQWSGPINDGVANAIGNLDPTSQALFFQIQRSLIDAPLSATVQAVVQLVWGQCDPSQTSARCHAQSLDAGIVPRADDLVDPVVPHLLYQQALKCAAGGLTGPALAHCTAPARSGTFALQ